MILSDFSLEYDVVDLGFGTGVSQDLVSRNAQNTTSGIKIDFGFGNGMPENLYVEKFCQKTSFWPAYGKFCVLTTLTMGGIGSLP